MCKGLVVKIRFGADSKLVEKYDVYIGRRRWVNGRWVGGYYGNPFVIGRDGDRAEVIAKFRARFYARIEFDEEYRNNVLKLRGKKLGCWCGEGQCHGDVIVEWLEMWEMGFVV